MISIKEKMCKKKIETQHVREKKISFKSLLFFT